MPHNGVGLKTDPRVRCALLQRTPGATPRASRRSARRTKTDGLLPLRRSAKAAAAALSYPRNVRAAPTNGRARGQTGGQRRDKPGTDRQTPRQRPELLADSARAPGGELSPCGLPHPLL